MENMNKDYEAEDIYWYHAIYEMTDSESEAIELYFFVFEYTGANFILTLKMYWQSSNFIIQMDD